MIALERRVVALMNGEASARCEPVGSSPPEHRPASVFRREGEYWSIRFGSDELRMRDAKGLRYLAQLLGSPGREFLALDLATAGSVPRPGAIGRRASRSASGLGEPILDDEAKAAYRSGCGTSRSSSMRRKPGPTGSARPGHARRWMPLPMSSPEPWGSADVIDGHPPTRSALG